MKLKIASLLIFMGSFFAAKAQHSIGPEIGLPLGALSSGSSFMIGATYRYTHQVRSIDELKVLGTGGLYYFFPKGGGSSSPFIVLKGGASYDFTESIAGAMELGIGIFTGQGGGNSIVFGPGVIIKLTEQMDLNPRFEFYDGGSQLAVRLGFHF
jgi:hypothetical protein